MAGAKPDALLLDEMFSPAIADELSSRGVDCRAVAADAFLRAHDDLEIFETALLESRVLVTNNVPDFESLRRARQAVGGDVPGLIYTSDVAFPRSKAYFIRLVSALEIAAAGHVAAACGGVFWLQAPSDVLSKRRRPEYVIDVLCHDLSGLWMLTDVL